MTLQNPVRRERRAMMIIQVTDGDNTLSRNESALNLKLARLIVETKRRPRPDVKVRHTDGGVGREGGVGCTEGPGGRRGEERRGEARGGEGRRG